MTFRCALGSAPRDTSSQGSARSSLVISSDDSVDELVKRRRGGSRWCRFDAIFFATRLTMKAGLCRGANNPENRTESAKKCTTSFPGRCHVAIQSECPMQTQTARCYVMISALCTNWTLLGVVSFEICPNFETAAPSVVHFETRRNAGILRYGPKWQSHVALSSPSSKSAQRRCRYFTAGFKSMHKTYTPRSQASPTGTQSYKDASKEILGKVGFSSTSRPTTLASRRCPCSCCRR